MIKLVAFDWNGTLLSDTWAALKSDNIALKEMGFKPISRKTFTQAFDIPIKNYWNNIGMGKDFFETHMVKIEKLFQKNYEKFADKTRSRAGSKEVLKWLKQNNITAMIYSNHTTTNIIRQLNRLGIAEYIDTVLARPDHDVSHLHARGKAEKLYAFVKKNKFKPKEVVSVGDTEEEIEIGKHQGFHTVAITGGYNNTARLKKHRPDFLIHNMLELKKIIKKLNN